MSKTLVLAADIHCEVYVSRQDLELIDIDLMMYRACSLPLGDKKPRESLDVIFKLKVSYSAG